MFRHFLKSAWRNLFRQKIYGFINIFGLATGLAVALTIGLWVYHEYSFDKFLPNHSQLYQVRRNYNSNGEILNFTTTSRKLAIELKERVPEIERVVVTDWMGPHGLLAGEKKIYSRGAIVDSGFLQMFQYPLIKGTAASVLQEPYSIVLTASLAKTLFGDTDPMNKTVRFENKTDLKVTGILKDLPSNSSFQFNYLIPYAIREAQDPGFDSRASGSFGNNNWQQFVQLKDGISLAQVASKVLNITHSEKENVNAMNSLVVLQPISRWHLYGTYENGKDASGFIDYVKMFSLIAILVLVIACINFINLTTARSEKRAREVGVRKAIGSERLDLINQFLIESLLLTSLAMVLAFVMVVLVLPYFNILTGKQVTIPYNLPIFWLTILGTVLLTAIASGSRPAIYLSSFQPVKVLKGTLVTGNGAGVPRKALVVIQFSCSIALIISTIIVHKQIQFVKDRPIGFNTNRLMMTDMNADLTRNYPALKDELLQKRIADAVTVSSSPATDIYWHSGVDNWPGKNAGETIEMATIVVSADYFKTMGIEFQQGHDFSSVYDSTKVIFNEAAIQQMRIKDPLSQFITWDEKKFDIIGVTKNALIASPFIKPEPTMFLMSPDPQDNLIYRLDPRISTTAAIDQLNKIFAKYNPAYPYGYEFADASYAEKFSLEVLIGKLAGIFSALAIFVSCLGLFGLATFIAEQRTKEIGIRKVLGANISQVWYLLSKDFMIPVFISCIVAIPISIYFLQKWLAGYSYRTNIGVGVFFLAAGIAFLISLITVSFQAIKSALANPIKSLKTE